MSSDAAYASLGQQPRSRCGAPWTGKTKMLAVTLTLVLVGVISVSAYFAHKQFWANPDKEYQRDPPSDLITCTTYASFPASRFRHGFRRSLSCSATKRAWMPRAPAGSATGIRPRRRARASASRTRDANWYELKSVAPSPALLACRSLIAQSMCALAGR
jgi:hypothetical protein